MRAVITGGTGAIGMALIDELISRNTEVLVLLREGANEESQLPNHPLVKSMYCSLEHIEDLTIPGEKYDEFYHLAWAGTVGDARSDTQLQISNIKYGVDAAFLAARLGCSVFVGAGSQAEYGVTDGKLSSDTPAFPQSAYGAAKLCAGQMTRFACRALGLRHVWARILSVYGPYESKNSLLSYAINQLLGGKSTAFTACEQTWDFMYSADAARALIALAERGRDGGVYCLGSGKARTLREYLELVRDKIDKDAVLGFGAIPYSEGHLMHLEADIGELTRDTGYVPSTSFDEGIEETIRFYRVQSAEVGEGLAPPVSAECRVGERHGENFHIGRGRVYCGSVTLGF